MKIKIWSGSFGYQICREGESNSFLTVDEKTLMVIVKMLMDQEQEAHD